MPERARPTWDVPGLMHAAHAGTSAVAPWRIRTYPDGHGTATIDGVTYPIPSTMTAVEYLEMGFAALFGGRDERTGSGG